MGCRRRGGGSRRGCQSPFAFRIDHEDVRMNLARQRMALPRRLGLPRIAVSERLAVIAGIAAALASLAGFIPGVYRDPQVVIAQSHGFDIGNLIAVMTLGLGIAWSSRGSVRGRLVAVGALGYLIYSFVTYAFLIVLNAATVLYIAALAFGVWSFIAGFAAVDDREADQLAARYIYPRLDRKSGG